MKKIVAILLSIALLMTSLAMADAAAGEKKLKIVTTIFPIYDWVREITGGEENADLTLLLDSGVDLHSYQPTAEDIMRIATCDVFLYVGGESDEWVEDALKEAVNPQMTVINLLETLGEDVKMEEIVEGMEHDHDHEDHDEHDDHDADHDEHDADHEEHDEDHDADHDEHDEDHDADHDGHDEDHDADHDGHDEDHDADHEEHDEDHDADHDGHDEDHDADHDDHDEDHDPEDDHDHDHDHGEEADEHVWLSLRNAGKLVTAIAGKLAEADPARAEAWKANAAAYGEKLSALDAQYTEMVSQAAFKTILFGDRFPFRYLADDYGLTYYAAFAGCSAETEASFQTIVFLAGKVDELGLPAVLTIEGANHKIAETVIQTTGKRDQKLLTMNSMQGVTAADVQAGATYLSIMQANLETLKEALN